MTVGLLRRSPNEGRSAAEMYGKKKPDRIVRDQCRDNTQQRGKGK
jgi:hypothetical protein